ncbi:hypothetical protein LTR85_008733 [Meristemomyces frigidus]|nr:hypothetical protein LTR85_008733 [Meristemomyces frigidus]
MEQTHDQPNKTVKSPSKRPAKVPDQEPEAYTLYDTGHLLLSSPLIHFAPANGTAPTPGTTEWDRAVFRRLTAKEHPASPEADSSQIRLYTGFLEAQPKRVKLRETMAREEAQETARMGSSG